MGKNTVSSLQFP